MPTTTRSTAGGFTFIENVVAMGIVAIFFSSLYAMSAQCLYVLNSGREAVSAGQGLQDRMEQFRGATWLTVSDASLIGSSILNTPANSSEFLNKVTEVVTVDSYPTASGTPIQITRANGTVTINATNATISAADQAVINIIYYWRASPSGRPLKTTNGITYNRSQSINTIRSANSGAK